MGDSKSARDRDRAQRELREEARSQTRLKGFNAAAYVRPGTVTKDQVLDMKQVFDMIDTDFSNEIDPKEIARAAQAMSVELDKNAENEIRELYDGRMTWEIFFDCMTRQLTREDLPRTPQFFALLDEDKTGTISLENLKSAARKSGSRLKPGEITEMFDMLNTRRGTAQDDGELDMLDVMLALEAGIASNEESKRRAVERERMAEDMLEGRGALGTSAY